MQWILNKFSVNNKIKNIKYNFLLKISYYYIIYYNLIIKSNINTDNRPGKTRKGPIYY